ncbi:MAG TPA: signal peptidase I [Sutterella sp.]|nr:signal peptidase I [Sutterella sp.]
MNFSLLLLILSVFTGIMWVLDLFIWKPRRKAEAKAVSEEFNRANAEAIDRGDSRVIALRDASVKACLRMPWWLDYTAGLFWVILLVFLFRSFAYEPFRIPSGSMLPTLHVGDFILVNKFEYGIRLPVANKKVIALGSPKRGDVIVFRYPVDPSYDYIKRVVGIPGDVVEYTDKRLFINGKEMKRTDPVDWVAPDTMRTLTKTTENLDGVLHETAVDDSRGPGLYGRPYPAALRVCRYRENGFTCHVPADSYFVMGDNRDNSEDSRYWGIVPDENLVGRAFFIWANFSDFSRIGSFR